MKTPNSTDHIFREKLGEYASEVPAGLWDAIDSERSRKQRAVLWLQRKGKWGVLMVLFFLMAGAGYFLTVEEEQFNVHGGVEVDEKNMKSSANFEVVDKGNLDEIIDKETNKTITEKQAARPPIYNENNSLIAEKSGVTKIIKKSKNTTPIRQMPFVKSANVLKENTPNVKNLDVDKAFEKTFTNNSISTINNEPTPSNLTNLQVKKLSENNLLSTLEIPALSELKSKKKPDPCYAFNPYDSGKRGPAHLYFDVLAGPDYAHRTLEAKNADLAEYATIRDSTETSRLGVSSMVRLSMVFGNGIALRSGIAYAQINEKLDLFDGTTTDIEIYEIKDVHGNVIDIQMDTIIGQRIKTTYNRFQMVDVPVILGYEVRDRKWTLSMNGGAFFNVLFQQKGEFLSPNLTPVNFSSNATPQYQAYSKSVGMSLFGSVGVNYKISNRLHLMVEPHFRYYMDSFTNANYPLKQNYWAVGMNAGIRMQIF